MQLGHRVTPRSAHLTCDIFRRQSRRSRAAVVASPWTGKRPPPLHHSFPVPVFRCFSTSRDSSSGGTIALLIDGDHIPPKALKPLVDALTVHGHVSPRRFYAVAHKVELWRAQLEEHGMEAVAVRRADGGRSDSSDIVMALDAAELALKPLPHTPRHPVVGLAVASDDTDFALVLERAAAWGLATYALVSVPGGHTQPALAHRQVWESAGAHVVPYQLPVDRAKKSKSMSFNPVTGELSVKDIDAPAAPGLSAVERNDVLEVLSALGYISPAAQGFPMSAVVKFCAVNDLGWCPLRPLWRMDEWLLEAVQSAQRDKHTELRPDPGDLVVIDRIRKGQDSDTMKRLRAGGPVLLRIGPCLVLDVMKCLGFLDHTDSTPSSGDQDRALLHEAMEVFVTVNRTLLMKDHGLVLDDLRGEALQQRLHELFARQTERQKWRIMLSDGEMRRRLGLSAEAPRSEVLDGLKSYLGRHAKKNAEGMSYQRALKECMDIVNRRDPERRS
eukprot:TRINITY_DN32710_c0_g1_i2.p1 TRINITY_DN32710_c0_g1~~TRINITY_DN32710_c0_g1_i2.p1  ORF type:complete len:500 (-),score=79.53 TRINITY_DN32710_c0_g1_i2:16-1515(-)